MEKKAATNRPKRTRILERRKFLQQIGSVGVTGLSLTGAPFLAGTRGESPGEVLYNGIRAPSVWPRAPPPCRLSRWPFLIWPLLQRSLLSTLGGNFLSMIF